MVLDDTYNAAPDSMIAALDLLAACPAAMWPSWARCSSWVRRRRTSAWGSTPPSESTSSERRSRPAIYVVPACGPWIAVTAAATDRDRAARPAPHPAAGRRRAHQGSRGEAIDLILADERPDHRHAARCVTITAALVQAILLTFALVVILMPPFILLLRRLGFGKRIRVEGPARTTSRRARRRWAAC